MYLEEFINYILSRERNFVNLNNEKRAVLIEALIKESQNFLLKGLKFSRGIDFIYFSEDTFYKNWG